MNQRPTERHARFQAAFSQMPYWETWKTVTPCDSGKRDDDNKPVMVDVKRNHCKSIPRRIRRAMARVRAKREWQTARGLIAPEKKYPPHIPNCPKGQCT